MSDYHWAATLVTNERPAVLDGVEATLRGLGATCWDWGESVMLPDPIPHYDVPINKAGVHIVGTNRNGYGEMLRICRDAGKPISVAKVFMTSGAEEAKSYGPTYGVYRGWAENTLANGDTPPGNWSDGRWLGDIRAFARDWMACFYSLWEPLRASGEIDFFEWLNEPDPSDAAGIARAAEFVQLGMEDAEAHGFKTAIWSFTAGLPRSPTINPTDAPQAEAILTTLKWAAEHGHVLSLHDGSVNDERRLLKQGWEDKTALRYRYIKALMDQRGWPMPYTVLTEVYQVDGYRRPDWDDWYWYLKELQRDNYVLGSAWFTLGPYSFDGGQTDVNIAGQIIKWAERVLVRL